MSPTLNRWPALAPSLALLCGVALSRPANNGWLLLPLLLLLPGSRGARPRSLLAWLLIPTALACGLWLGGRDRRVADGRIDGIFAADARAVEAHLQGRLRSAPLRMPDGSHRMSLVGQLVSPTVGQRGPLVAELRVERSPPAAEVRLEHLAPGDRVRVFGRAWRPRPRRDRGLSDPAVALAARGLDLRVSVKSARLVEVLEPGGSGGARATARLRGFVRTRLELGFSRPTAALLRALLLGDRSALCPSALRRLRRSGLMHLVAVSGLHVGLLWLGTQGGLRRCGMGHPAIGLASCLLPLAYGLAVGGRPSVVRAVAAVIVVASGRVLGREGQGVNTLALLAAGALLYRPVWIVDPSFQLSFAATGGILLLQRPLAASIALPGILRAPLAVSLAAYAATAPIAAWHFGWLAPAGLWANIAAVPLCALLLCGGAAGVATLGWSVLGQVGPWFAETVARSLMGLAACAASAGPSFGAARPAAWLVVGYYGCLLAHRLTSHAAAKRALHAGLALALLGLHHGPPPARATAFVDAQVLDVGQAQAVALVDPRGSLLLVDAAGSYWPGSDPGRRIVLPLLRRAGHRRIAALVLSHGHVDHAGGAESLIRDAEIGELWVGPRWQASQRLRGLVSLAVDAGIAVVQTAAGEHRLCGELPVDVLWPPASGTAAPGNASSLVLRVGPAEARLLVPGDIASMVERRLLAGGAALEARALVLAHHGSRHGNSRAFLRRVSPDLVLVSCGRENRFGHPHDETLHRLRALRLPLWRTDREGTVRLSAGPGAWKVSSALVPRETRVPRRRASRGSE